MTRTSIPTPFASRRAVAAFVAAVLAVHFVLLLAGTHNKSATVDEYVHLATGCHYWKTGDFSLSGLNPPTLKLYSTLPVMFMSPKVPSAPDADERTPGFMWRFSGYFMNLNWNDYDAMTLAARVPVMLLSVLTGLVLFVWVRRWAGLAPAALALVLYAVEPNVLAHGRLATQDTGMMLAVLLTLWRLDVFLRKGRWWRALLAGAALGLASLVKFSGLVVALAVPLVFLACVLFVRGFTLRFVCPLERFAREGRLRQLYRSALAVLVIALVAAFVVNLQYGFGGTFRSLKSLDAKSAAMKRLAGSPLGVLPVPLPRLYLQGLDGQQLSSKQGETVNYLNGKWSRRGWWYYYLEAFALKAPIPVMALAALGLAGVLFSWRRPGTTAWTMMIAGALFWAMHSFGTNKMIGFRYMLPLMPLALSLAGLSVLLLNGLSRHARAALAVLLVLLVIWTAAETACIHPDYLAYFNEFAGGPDGGARYLLDSNIDWGQDLKGLAAWLKKEQIAEPITVGYFGHVAPELYGIRTVRLRKGARGAVAVSLNYLRGMEYLLPSGYFDWLKDEKPAAVIGHTIYVYRLDEK